jgi:predicted TPR repeat methyltransferase
VIHSIRFHSVEFRNALWTSLEGFCHSCRVDNFYFDERIAERYETYWPELFQPEVVQPAVNFLSELAGTGAALELGIGTGRLALPLRKRGVRVHGIELSPAMVAKLRTKPDSDDIGVTIGDFATKVSGRFEVA